MSEDRRGFLKQLVAAGSALILPNSEKKIILPEDVVDAPKVEAGACLDLGDCIVIPKANVMTCDVVPKRDDAYMLRGAYRQVIAGIEYVDVNIHARFYAPVTAGVVPAELKAVEVQPVNGRRQLIITHTGGSFRL